MSKPRPHYSRPSRSPRSEHLRSLQELDKLYAELTRQSSQPVNAAEINQHYAKPTHPVSGEPSPEDDNT